MKKIGSTVYIHYSARRQLTKEQKDLLWKASNICKLGFNKSEIYKIDLKNERVSFIECDDFDVAREPQVGKSWVVDVEKNDYKEVKPKGQIYHHKWMFVEDNYTGFDIEESKRWSEKWQSVIPAEKSIKSRIGYKKYWDEYLREYSLDVE